mgnify:CR=1 FL=1
MRSRFLIERTNMTEASPLTQLGARVGAPDSPDKAVLEVVPFARGDGPAPIVRGPPARAP